METLLLSADQLRAYATGAASWASLRMLDVSYAEVLAGLGELGLRPPMAPMAGPNLEARQRGLKQLRSLLLSPPP